MSTKDLILASAGLTTIPTYVDDVFSTYLYTGTKSTQTINNGIDLAGKGGMVLVRDRTLASSTIVCDTVRGLGSVSTLLTNSTSYSLPGFSTVNAYNSNGFGVGSDTWVNANGDNYVSWTFRKAPKFFDIVTYTGTGSAQNIAHNLGSAPRFMIVKRTDTTGNWCTYHSDLGATQIMFLNTTASTTTNTTYWNSTNPTSAVFSLGTNVDVNATGGTYVAYLFAHNEGGFGLTGTDNVISCGSFVGSTTVNLGWEPQWLLIKNTADSTDSWYIIDTMRGLTTSDYVLISITIANTETTASLGGITSTGFTTLVGGANTWVYVAIRRPNKPPTSGTQVYNAVARTGSSGNITTVGFSPDLTLIENRTSASYGTYAWDKLRGVLPELLPTSNAAESTANQKIASFDMSGISFAAGNGYATDSSFFNYINWFFKRAPGFFDIVCYTGTGVPRTINHNLGAAPQLMFVKGRTDATSPTNMFWAVYNTTIGNSYILELQSTMAKLAVGLEWWTSDGVTRKSPDATSIYLGTGVQINQNGEKFVAYLFSTLAGISKVGSYTGNGTSQTIDCGFSAGARFILIKRTDSTGDWYVWDTTRGIVAGNDPHLSLNNITVEVTTDDSIDPDSTGFIVNQVTGIDINVSAAIYIYLAIA